ncbi:hypothetical protein BJF85_22645 [Saccharomonospora sp. CUA-673]|nr:hypothetical protein BJF85_22645 [Saccharomonospora sp. CUA-673]
MRLAVYPTAIGPCGIAWRNSDVADGDATGEFTVVVACQLPDGDADTTMTRLRERVDGGRECAPSEAPASIRSAIALVTASLAGQDVDLSTIPLDLDGVPPFAARVYAQARAIPRGTTVTYGELAARLGDPGAARAVGGALGANTFAPIVPCHRILAADGRPGGFSAPGGLATKERILAAEGVHLTEPTLF